MRFDLHVHSKYSFDSLMDSKTIIKTANKKGLKGLAITDHNTILGARKTGVWNESPLMIIIGSEVSTDVGDIIGLFLTDDIKSHDSLEVLDNIKSQGGLSVLPHPFKGHKLTGDKASEILRRIDCLEILNSRAHSTSREFQHLRSLGRGLVAGSDAHFPAEIGLCQTIISKDIGDLEQIKNLILSKENLLIGNYGARYFQTMSQIIRNIKFGRMWISEGLHLSDLRY